MTQVLGIRNLSYKAFADDAAGTGFTLNNDPSKDYMAIITSPVVLDPPTAADFAGEWFKRKGEQGDQGVQGPLGPQGPSSPAFLRANGSIASTPALTFDEFKFYPNEEISSAVNLTFDAGVDGREIYWAFEIVSGSGSISVSADFVSEAGSILPAALQLGQQYIMRMKFINFDGTLGNVVMYSILQV